MKPEQRRQLEAIFAFMCQYQREASYPPSLREIGKTFYISPGTAMRYLDKMEALGWIARESGTARGITLLRGCGADGEQD